MTEYKLNHFTMADAQALAGKTADITEWTTTSWRPRSPTPARESPASSSFPVAAVAGMGDYHQPQTVAHKPESVLPPGASHKRICPGCR